MTRLKRPVSRRKRRPVPEARLLALQVGEHAPEQLLGHRRVAMFAGVREAVAARRRGAADAPQPTDIVTQGIAHAIKADGMGELRIEHRRRRDSRR